MTARIQFQAGRRPCDDKWCEEEESSASSEEAEDATDVVAVVALQL
jgi:hypothetical protein